MLREEAIAAGVDMRGLPNYMGAVSRPGAPAPSRVKSGADNRPNTSLRNLWDRHHEMIRMTVMGMKEREIALIMGLKEETVKRTLCSELAQRQLRILRTERDKGSVDVANEIRRLSIEAVRVLEETMQSDDSRLRFTAAKDVLDRAGFGAPTKVVGQMLHAHLTVDDLADIKQRALQMGALRTVERSESPYEMVTTTTSTMTGQASEGERCFDSTPISTTSADCAVQSTTSTTQATE